MAPPEGELVRVDHNRPLGHGLSAAVLVAIGVLVGKPETEIEGVYFNRSVGEEATAGVLAETGPGPLSPSDGNLWLGAGIALGVVAVGAAVAPRVRSR
jgi:hypothetical protein